jgi:predicted ATPase/DNA-binding SARP family transcriptional activator
MTLGMVTDFVMDEVNGRKLLLLGPVRVLAPDGEKTTRFRSQRTQALLGYLAADQRPFTRDTLATLFWPNDDAATAKANLRRELHNLGLILPGCWQSDQTAVQFTPTPDTLIDIDEVLRLEAAGQWAQAAEWLRGEFLEGISLADNLEFDVWLNGEREYWQQLTERILLRAADLHWLADEAELSRRTLGRLVRLYPWHEEAHRRLMLLLARQGSFSAALKQFQRCREALEAELDVPPSAASESLYRRIKLVAEYTLPEFPPSPTPFVGRESEMARLRQNLLNPDCRLLTITGLGGIGKSRLAVEVARNLGEGNGRRFLHGAAFASLSGVPPEECAAAIARAVRIRFHGSEPAENQLLHQLRDWELLLLLDNYEHLLPNTELVERILAEAPGVTLLVTSRERLHLQEEWAFALEGLPCPPPGLAASEIMTYASVQLFADAAERTGYPFSLEQYSQEVAKICRLVQGMPLALLLAAPWIETLTPAEIAAEICQNLNFLQARYRNLPLRQQSIQIVFEAAWSRLPIAEQAALAALSLFQGGFTARAAQKVAGASPALLADFLEKTLIWPDRDERYNLHELLRPWLKVQLEAKSAAETTHRAHLNYFVTLAEEAETRLDGPNQLHWLNRLENDRHNLTAALNWAYERGHLELAARLAGALGGFWAIRGYLSEGEEWLNKVLAQGDKLTARTKARALLACGWLAFEEGDFAQARICYTDSLAHWRKLRRVDRIAELLNRLGHTAQREGDFLRAIQLYQESEALYRLLDDKRGIALSLNRLGHVMQLMGNQDRAAALVTESLAIRRAIEDKRGIAASLNTLAEIARLRGEDRQAEVFYRECLVICQELGDKRCVAGVSHNLAHVRLRLGEADDAAALFANGLAFYQRVKNKEGIALCLAGLAGVSVIRGKLELAARLFGAADAMLEASGAFLNPADSLAWRENVARLREQLEEKRLRLAWDKGRVFPINQIIREALRER